MGQAWVYIQDKNATKEAESKILRELVGLKKIDLLDHIVKLKNNMIIEHHKYLYEIKRVISN